MTDKDYFVKADGSRYVKVVDFPSTGVHQGVPISHESMWVMIVDGDENNGIGVLDNKPAFNCVAAYGDLVSYKEGSPTLRPRFDKVVEVAVG